jgi:hypothetical protein
MEPRTDPSSGDNVYRERLGTTLYGSLWLQLCEREEGVFDLMWQGADPERAICEDLKRFMVGCWDAVAFRTGKRLPQPKPIPTSKPNVWWLARLAPGRYLIERDEEGGQCLFELQAPPPPKTEIVRRVR